MFIFLALSALKSFPVFLKNLLYDKIFSNLVAGIIQSISVWATAWSSINNIALAYTVRHSATPGLLFSK